MQKIVSFSKIFKSITKKEWYFSSIIFLVLVVLTTAPLIYGILIAPQGSVVTGVQFVAQGDLLVYFSHIEQVKQGNYFLSNLFGGSEQAPIFNIFWLGTGMMAKIFSLPVLVAFHLTRILLMGLLVATVYFLLSIIFNEARKRMTGLAVLFFSSGLGMFLIDRLIRFPQNYAFDRFNWPMDLWVPELSVFNTVYYSPHFIASLVLMLTVFIFSLLFVHSYKYRYSLLAALSSLALISFHPFYVLTIFSITGVYFFLLAIIFKKNILHLAFHYFLLAIITAPVIWYYLNLISTDWVMAVRAGQNLTPTTPLWITLFSYGFFVPLALVGSYLIVKRKSLSPVNLFIIVWAVVGFVLIYSPVNYQRRLTEGLIIPLMILTLIAVYYILETRWYEKYFKSKASIMIALVIFFLPLSNIFTLSANGYMYRSQRLLSYLENETIQAIEWLKDNVLPEEMILSGVIMSQFIPAYSARSVYASHGVETPFYRQRVRGVQWFFGDNHQADLEKNFLAVNNISYIFYDATTSELGSFSADDKPYLIKVFDNSSTRIYKVTLN